MVGGKTSVRDEKEKSVVQELSLKVGRRKLGGGGWGPLNSWWYDSMRLE